MRRRAMIIAIIIIGLVCFAVYEYRLSQKYAGVIVEKSPVVVGGHLVDEKTYQGQDPYVSFSVAYPTFTNASAEFNASIAQAVQDALASHVQEATDNWQSRYKTQTKNTPKKERITKVPTEKDKMPFYVTYDVVQANQSMISVLLHIGGDTGGAHGYETLAAFNYNVVTGRPMTLAEVYYGTDNYLQVISKAVRIDLAKQFTSSGTLDESIGTMLDAGTEPDLQNFKNFTIDQDPQGKRRITFYFDQYQVAPYVYGQPQVTLML